VKRSYGDLSFTRREILRAAATLPAAGLLLPAAASAAPARTKPTAAPMLKYASSGQKVVHYVYSSLPLDKTTLKALPAGTTTNAIEYFQWSVDEFKKTEPDIDVQLEFLPHDNSWFAKIDSSLVAGNPPDVVQGPVSEAAKYAPLGALAPIDAYLTDAIKADLVKSILDQSSLGGHYYLWPWRLSFGGGIEINKTLWEANNAGQYLPTGDTRRWLMDDCLKAFQATTTGTSLYGTVLSTDIWYQIGQFMFGFGARLFNDDETQVILNSPEGVDGLQWLIDLEQKYKVAVPGGAVRKATEADALFLNRKAASFPSQGAGLKPASLNGVTDFDWFWAPPPNVPGKTPAVMTNIQGHYVFQQKDQNRTDAAQKWAQFLVRPEALALSLAQFGMPPALQSLWTKVTDPNQKVGLSFTDIMIGFGTRASAAPITFDVAPRMLQAALSGQKTAKQALDDFASESNKLIEQAIQGG
jgi:multiple sugar transport system substrate-binding protein